MYIINPNQEQLDEWYKCNKITYEYLFYKKYISPISKFGEYYYYAITEELENMLENLPVWLKVYNLIMSK